MHKKIVAPNSEIEANFGGIDWSIGNLSRRKDNYPVPKSRLARPGQSELLMQGKIPRGTSCHHRVLSGIKLPTVSGFVVDSRAILLYGNYDLPRLARI